MRRKTIIIATLGPACQTISGIKALIRAGVGILRINASHTETCDLPKRIELIRKSARALRRSILVLVDLQGPRIRTGRLLKGSRYLEVKKDQTVSIHIDNQVMREGIITTTYRKLPDLVKRGSQIFLDNGIIELKVVRVHRNRIECRVVTGGQLGENKGMNIPNAEMHLPPLSRKDRMDLRAAAKAGADLIGASFVQNERDVALIKRALQKQNKKIPVIAKIEKRSAVVCIDALMKVADGVMVARGDLGIEVGVEKVPFIQKSLIRKSNQFGIPVITATQMLETMINSKQPTRAEVSDIANAVMDGSHAVMLSGETAIGQYPVQCVKMMASIIDETEKFMIRTASVIIPGKKEMQKNKGDKTHTIYFN